jgi:probable O-glycosylation ligase (exosortase A-associated)
MRSILLLFIMVVVIPASFFSPFIGLLSFTAFAYTRPHEWAYVESAQYSLAIATATLLGYLILELPRRSPRLISNLLLVLLWVQLTISTTMAQSTTLAMPKYLEFSKILIIALLTTAMMVTEQRIWWMLFVTLSSIGLIVLKSCAGVIYYRGEARIYGTGGSFGDNNDFAILLALTLPIMYYFAMAQTRLWLKIGFYALSGMTVVAALFTYSRGGLLGLSVGVIVLILKSHKKMLALVISLILALATLAVLPQNLLKRFASIQNATQEDQSAQERLRMWGISWEIIKDYPLVGVGIRNILMVQGHYTVMDEKKLVAHNSYLQIATDAGLPALALFLALFAITWWRLIRARWILKVYAPDSPLIKYSHGMEAGMFAYMAAGFFASRQDLELLYTVFALAASLIPLAREYEREARTREYVERQGITPVRSREAELDAA